MRPGQSAASAARSTSFWLGVPDGYTGSEGALAVAGTGDGDGVGDFS